MNPSTKGTMRELSAISGCREHQLAARRPGLQSNDALAFLFEQNTWHHWVPTESGVQTAGQTCWNRGTVLRLAGGRVTRWSSRRTGFNGYTRLDTNGHPHK